MDVQHSFGVLNSLWNFHVGRTVKRSVFVDAHVEINDLVKYPSRALALEIRNALIELIDNVMYCLFNLVFVEEDVRARVHVGLGCYTSEWFYKLDAQTRNYLDVLELVDLPSQQTGKSIFLR